MTTEAAWVTALLVWALASFVYRGLGLRALGRVGRRQVDDAAAAPVSVVHVALLRPACGAPSYLEECLTSLWRAAGVSDTPIFVGIQDPGDPAHKDVTRVCEAQPSVAATVTTGAAGSGRNRKIANVVQLGAEGAADVLVLSDADIRVPVDYVARVSRPFADSRVGFATAAYRSVPCDSLASRCDALLTNFHFLPNTCFAVEFEGLHFGLGSTLAVRREALASIGGFAAIVDESGDDSALAHRIEARGWKLAWLPFVVDHLLADVGWRAAFARHVRCARITRALRPAGFVGLLAVTHGWVPALAAGIVASAPGLLAPLVWWGGMMAFQWGRRRDLGLAPRDIVLSPAIDVLGLAVMVAAHWGRPTPP